MIVSKQTLENLAESSNFRIEILEKVLKLVELLELLFKDEVISQKLVLKGGTALNLFLYNLPRLSVDIDLNYIGTEDASNLGRSRKVLEKRLHNILIDNSYKIQSQPKDYAGGKYRLKYESKITKYGTIELDINYLLRVPLWTPSTMNSIQIDKDISARNIMLLDMHEIAGGKFAALFDRCSSRDLFDSLMILSDDRFQQEKLRLAFVIYGAQSRKDWRTINLDSLHLEDAEFRNMLIPMIRKSTVKEFQSAKEFLEKCKEYLHKLLPFRENEIEFLNLLLDQGMIEPSLLTEDTDLKNKILTTPALRWKSLNVLKHKSI